MKGLVLIAAILLCASPAFAAPLLAWDAVTTGSDGLPLDPGLQVLEYYVYQCTTGIGSCTKAGATRVSVVVAPATPTVQFDLVGQPVPAAYLVTAVNIVQESGVSIPLKVVPPDIPKNVKLR